MCQRKSRTGDGCSCDIKVIAKLDFGAYEKMHDINQRLYSPNGIAPSVTCGGGGNREVKILEIKADNMG